MAYKARIKNNICTNAHPLGCYRNIYHDAQVASAVSYAGPKMALVVGASSGIGLASRMSLAFGAGADTLGVYYERAAQAHKFGTAGWYNNQGFEYFARRAGLNAYSTNQDAFQKNAKEWVIQRLKQLEKPLELLVYSLAAPRRKVRGVGEFQSVIKPIKKPFDGLTVDVFENKLREQHIEPANTAEVDATVKVMGGEDWHDWVMTLQEAGVLAENFKTIAYSYLGPEQTQGIYGQGTLGSAKAHLHETSIALNEKLRGTLNGEAKVGLYQAVVTPSSSVIPSMPLYLSIFHKTLKESGKYESVMQQTNRMFAEGLYGDNESMRDGQYLRVDQIERDASVQAAVNQAYDQLATAGLEQVADTQGFKQAFLQQFGFGLDEVDYTDRPDPLLLPATADFAPAERKIA